MRIAQISDIHADDTDSFKRLDRALDWLRQLEPDALIVSGDLSDPPRRAVYNEVRERLQWLNTHLQVVPGNVDDRELLREAFHQPGVSTENGPFNSVATVGGAVRLIGLDVTVPGAHHGDAAPILPWLREQLNCGGAPALIFMHQHPFMCGIDKKDKNKCRSAEELSLVIGTASDPVLAITCGHVHRPMFTRFANLPATMSPSITGANKLRLDGREPETTDPSGLLVHHYAEARLVTHVVSLG